MWHQPVHLLAERLGLDATIDPYCSATTQRMFAPSRLLLGRIEILKFPSSRASKEPMCLCVFTG